MLLTVVKATCRGGELRPEIQKEQLQRKREEFALPLMLGMVSCNKVKLS